MQSNLNQLGLASFPNLENQPNPENGLGNNDENNNEPVLPPSEGEGREGGTSNDKDNPEPQPKPDDDASKNEEGKPNEEDLDDVDDNLDEEYYEEGVLEEPDPTEDENDSQGNFFEDNKGLLTRVHNILKLKFPNSNISLSQLLTGAQQYIDMIASNPKGGQGDGEDVLGEGEEPESEIDISQFSDDDIDAIVNGFCKVYKTDWGEFLKIVTFYLNQDSFTQPEIKSCYFKYKKPDKQLDDIANPVNLAKYNEEFEKQNRLRISKLNNAVSYIIDSKPDNENELKKKLVEFCLNDKTAVLDYIEYLLKVFYDKWLLPDGSGDRFPYVINKSYNKIGNQDIGPRSGKYVIDEKDQNVKDSKVIKTEWDSVKNYIQYYKNNNNDCCKFYQDNKWKFERFISLNNEDDEKIELYYKKEEKTEKYTPKDDGKYIKYKNEYKENSTTNFQWFKPDESSTKKETFDLQLYSMKLSKIKEDKYYSDDGVDCNCEGGKGSVLFMQKVASSLLERFNNSEKQGLEKFFSNRYKHVYEANKNEAKKISYRFKDYLHDLGIGMDCSGYVPRALAFVMSELMIPGHEQIKTLGPAYGRLKTNMSTLRENDHSILVEKKVKNTITVGKETYEIRDVSNIHPGDITVNSSHIRIICEVDKNNNYFRVHESGSQGIKDSLRESERIGIIQTKVLDWVEKKPYTWEENNEIISSYTQKIKTGSFSIRRPSAFADPDKLREYFKNMLIAKGKESH